MDIESSARSPLPHTQPARSPHWTRDHQVVVASDGCMYVDEVVFTRAALLQGHRADDGATHDPSPSRRGGPSPR